MIDPGWDLAKRNKYQTKRDAPLTRVSVGTEKDAKQQNGKNNNNTNSNSGSNGSNGSNGNGNGNGSVSSSENEDDITEGTLFDAVATHTQKTTFAFFSHKGRFYHLMTDVLSCKRPRNTVVNMQQVINDVKLFEKIFTSGKLSKADMKTQCAQLLLNRSWAHIAEIVKLFKIKAPKKNKKNKNKNKKGKRNSKSDKNNNNNNSTMNNNTINIFEAFKMMDNLVQMSDTGKALTVMCRFAYKPYHFWAAKVEYINMY